MQDRRRIARNRVYYGGQLAFNARNSTLSCIVRNFNAHGARVEFDAAAFIPDRVDFSVARRGLCCLARLIWCDHDAAGLAFSDAEEAADIIPLDWARRLRDSDRANRQLKSRIDQLLSGR